MKSTILFVIISNIFICSINSISLHYNLNFVHNATDLSEPELSPDTYMSPFRRAREKSLSLALKKGNYSLRNELDKEYYQNYKVKKLSAKFAADQKREKSNEITLRPLSMRTLALKNNPIYGSNPNSMAYLQSLSARGPSRIQPTSFRSFGNSYFNPIQQMSRLRDQSLSDPNRNTNILRDQRLKLLEDEQFLRSNSRLGQFIYSKNRESTSFNPINQMIMGNDFRRQRFNPYPNMMQNNFVKPTKANFFKFEKPEEKNAKIDDDEYYYVYEDEYETEPEVKIINNIPTFQDTTTTSTIAPETTTRKPQTTTKAAKKQEIFKQTDDSKQRLVELIKEDLKADEDIQKASTKKPSVKKLSMSNSDTKLVDWDEIEKEDREYERTLNLQNALKSFLNSKFQNF